MEAWVISSLHRFHHFWVPTVNVLRILRWSFTYSYVRRLYYEKLINGFTNDSNLSVLNDYKVKPWSTVSQVVASWKLGSILATPFGQVLRALALTCDDFQSLWSRSNLHASHCKFFTVWPPNPSLFESWTCCYLRLLASPFDQGLRHRLTKLGP